MGKFTNISGQKFGKLIAICHDGKARDGRYKWFCKCDCGNTVTVRITSLKSGNTQSCGCLARNNRRTHGHFVNNKMSPTYNSWCHIIQRCTNTKNKDYNRYGGRGITVCERWRKFENFLEDMGEAPKGNQIDRINNNAGYHKENCRWATPKQNCRNRSTNHLETHNGKTQTLVEWAEETGISYVTIINRLKRGWTTDETLATTKVAGSL